MKEIEKYSRLETEIIELLNKGFNNRDKMIDNFSGSDKSFDISVSSLINRNIVSFDKKNNKYNFVDKTNGNLVILDGDLLLPVTVIKTNGKTYINRGLWYEIPNNFDIRRIVWNVNIPNTNEKNNTLVELLKTSVLKERKSRIEQLPEYENLKNKIVPYSDNIGLLIHTVGENATDVSIIFKIKLLLSSDISIQHRGFTVRTEISTQELIEELSKPVSDRNYKNIKLNKIFTFSDFVHSGNEIPISLQNGVLEYVKITGIRKNVELTYMKLDHIGNNIKTDVKTFEDTNEGIDVLFNIYNGFATKYLNKLGFLIENEDSEEN